VAPDELGAGRVIVVAEAFIGARSRYLVSFSVDIRG
jgi:hypothetical protein